MAADTKKKKRFGFLNDLVENTSDFGQAVVDRVGGGIVRGAVRLGAAAAEALPGEQRKGAERFIEENLEVNKRKGGIGKYDESSVGGRAGRVAGTVIKGGVDIAGAGKLSKVGRTLAKGDRKGVPGKVLGFLGASVGGTVGSLATQTGRGDVADVPKEFGTGFVVDALTGTGGSLLRKAAREAPFLAKKLAGPETLGTGMAVAEEASVPTPRPRVIGANASGLVDNAIPSARPAAAETPDIAPVTPKEGFRQRGLLKTTEQADSLPLQSRQAIREIEPQTYKQLNVEETLKTARSRVDTNFDEAKRTVDQSFESRVWDDQTSSLTRALVEKAAREGNDTLVSELMDKAASLGTASGQANVLWRGMASAYDPEGMVRFAQKEVDKANKNKGLLTKLFDKGDYMLDDTTKEFIRTEMRRSLKLGDSPEKDQIMKGILEKINERIPPGASEKFDAYRYQNLLSNPRTQARNTISNLFNTMITRPAALAARASTDWFGATLFGKERQYYAKEVPNYYKGLFNSFGDAIEASKAAWRRETPGNPDLRSLRKKNLPKYLTVVSDAMEAQDKFFMTLISSGEYAAQKAKGVADDVARKEAEKVAEYSLFRAVLDPHNGTGQGNLLSSIDKLTETVTKFGDRHKGFRWFVPFIRTPMNVTKQMIEFSPAGLATLPGNKHKAEQLSKAMTGTMITLIGAKMAVDGNTTWDAPKDEKERQLFYESGKRPYSIKIGDKWVPMIYFGPFSLAFALPAAARDANDDAPLDASVIEKIGATAQNSAKFFSQQTYVQGIANVVELVSGEGDANLANSLGFTAGQAIPLQGLQRYIAGVLDPTFRKADGFLESIQKDIPGLSQNLEPYTTLSGEESKRTGSDYLAPYTLGGPRGSVEDQAVQKANSEFLKTKRKTTRLRTRANEEINEAIAARDYAKAQQIANSYNARLKEAFAPWVKKYRSYADEFMAEDYTRQKIRLNRASIAQRRYNSAYKAQRGRSLVNE